MPRWRSYVSVIWAAHGPHSQKCSTRFDGLGRLTIAPSLSVCDCGDSIMKILPSRRYTNGVEQEGLAHFASMCNSFGRESALGKTGFCLGNVDANFQSWVRRGCDKNYG